MNENISVPPQEISPPAASPPAASPPVSSPDAAPVEAVPVEAAVQPPADAAPPSEAPVAPNTDSAPEIAPEPGGEAAPPVLLTAESQIAEVEGSVVQAAPEQNDASVKSTVEIDRTAADEMAPVEAPAVTPEARWDEGETPVAAPALTPVTTLDAVESLASSAPPIAPEALKALFPGAFLRGEYEVREILARGTTNLYRAVGGDYSSPENKLIAERAASTVEIDRTSTPASEVETAPTLRPAHETFIQDDREYLVYEWFESTSLQDWRGATNDEQLLKMLAPVAQFLKEAHARGESCDISTDTLRVDGSGELRFVGFTFPGEGAPLEDLKRVADFAFKHVFAQSATMRLDDRFAGLALSDELKEFARTLDNDAFASIDDAAAMLQSLAATNLRTAFALLSDVGQQREINEDAGMIVASQRAGHLQSYARELFVVSDGMGGHEGGEVASDLTISSLQQHLDALELDWHDNAAIRAGLIDVIDAVNADVVALTETEKYRGTRAKPGATLTFALRLGARMFIGNVGDSRAYLFRDGQLLRVSKDHSYVQNLIDRGELSEEDAWDHPEGSVITAHIGYPKLKTRDVFVRLARPGDRWLLVSDGVVDMLRDRDIAPHLQES
jgi:protein phosphatase